MARYFEIGSNTTSIKLDSQGKGSLQYKVKNVSGTPVDGRVLLVSLPETNPASGPVQKGWVKLESPADHYFERDEQTVFAVNIEVPAKERSVAGTYTFRLDAVLSAVPDRGDQGPGAALTFDAIPQPKSKKGLWLILLALAAVLLVGIGTWIFIRTRGVQVPDVSGKSVAEAIATLNGQKFVVDPAVSTVTSTADAVNKVVSTTPAAGTKAASGSSIHLAVGALAPPIKIKVPDVSGKLLIEAVTSLASAKLSIDPKVDSLSGDDTLVGKVVKETPAAGSSLVENGVVRLTVGTAKVLVPQLKGMTVSSAQSMLSSLQLGMTMETVVDPGSPAGTVVKQSQDAGARVDTNSSIQVSVTAQQVTVPNLQGKIPQVAAVALKAANLRLGSIQVCGGWMVAPVERQAPAPNEKVNAGSSVSIVLPCNPAIFPRNGVFPPFAPYRAPVQSTLPENSPYVMGLNNAAK